MNPPDSYKDLELDSAVLHKLALIEATLAASPSGLVNQSPPTQIPITQIYLNLLPRHPAYLPQEITSYPQEVQYQGWRSSGKANCKQRVRKRKVGVLDEGGDEEHVVGTHQRPRPTKHGRGQSTCPQSHSRPPPKVLRLCSVEYTGKPVATSKTAMSAEDVFKWEEVPEQELKEKCSRESRRLKGHDKTKGGKQVNAEVNLGNREQCKNELQDREDVAGEKDSNPDM
ncbi:hypothetical protein V8E53_013388 [Lactarius tabidus]